MLVCLRLTLLVGVPALFNHVVDMLNGQECAPVLCLLVLVGWELEYSLGLTDLNTSKAKARSSTDYPHDYSLIIPFLFSGEA